jgi:hypothetical protein
LADFIIVVNALRHEMKTGRIIGEAQGHHIAVFMRDNETRGDSIKAASAGHRYRGFQLKTFGP